MQRQIRVDFRHGVGDSSHFAHLIPMYQRRGYQMKVCSNADRLPLFQAAGATEISEERAPEIVLWLQPPLPEPDHFFHPAKINKAALNLNMYPLPFIGHPEELWEEYVGVEVSMLDSIEPAAWETVRQFTDPLPRPLILLHTMGVSFRNKKSLPNDMTLELFQHLLEGTEGTLVLLDWENKMVRIKSPRIRHLITDWKSISISELGALLAISDLLIGIDSGPLHLSRMTGTPALGTFFNTLHHPVRYCLPKAHHAFLIAGSTCPFANDIIRGGFNLLEAEGQPSAVDIATHAFRMVAGPRYVPTHQCGVDAFLQSWILDRFKSNAFDRLLREAGRRFLRPCLVEIGFSNPPESPAHQTTSAFLFATLSHHGAGVFLSLQRQTDHLRLVQDGCRFLRHSNFVKAHPLDELRRDTRPIDVLSVCPPSPENPYGTTMQQEIEAACPPRGEICHSSAAGSVSRACARTSGAREIHSRVARQRTQHRSSETDLISG